MADLTANTTNNPKHPTHDSADVDVVNRRSAMPGQHHVVVIGGGFAGLNATQKMAKNKNLRITLIDRRNFHLFQPLLYQLTTGGLSAGDIAAPLRDVLACEKNVEVLMGDVVDIQPSNQAVILRDGFIRYDSLIVAAGSASSYFGKDDQWAHLAPSLKSLEDALEMRRRILLAFEAAEREPDEVKRAEWLTFVVVGGGPTGVELAGALAELAHHTLAESFRQVNPRTVTILLVEAGPKVLATFTNELSQKALDTLERLGVTVRTSTLVTDIQTDSITVKHGDREQKIPTRVVLWGAGVKPSPLAGILARQTGAPTDRGGRIMVEPDFTVPGYSNIYVVGDLACYTHNQPEGKPLPGLAPVAIQQGHYVGQSISRKLTGQASVPFEYKDRGSMAVIGRRNAVAQINSTRLSGLTAWLLWAFVHIFHLIGFENRVLVFIQWFWHHLTFRQSSRIITGPDPYPLVSQAPSGAEALNHQREALHPATSFSR